MRLIHDEEQLVKLVHHAIAPLHHDLLQAIHRSEATLKGMRVRGAVPTIVNASNGSQAIAFGPGEWAGFLLTETSGTAGATISFYAGRNSLSDLIGTVTLSAGESTREIWPRGVTYADGLFLTVTGTVTGSVLHVAGA